MITEMQFGNSFSDLDHIKYDISFIGNPIDERGQVSSKYAAENSSRCITFKYVPKEFMVGLDERVFHKDDIIEELRALTSGNIIIDSTTLNFAELLIICQTLKDIGIVNIAILYIEPGGYNRKNKDLNILNKRDFELSDETTGFEAIPGHSLSLTNEVHQRVVFICGYEAERIDRAMEDSQIISNNCCCIFGVPAFSPGWEMDSFDNNISVLKERKINGGVNFCGATNPISVMQKLDEIYRGLDEDSQMFIVPLSSKPTSIGACLFLLSKPKDRVAVLFDHPTEMVNRAQSISDWHLFNIKLNV